MIERHLNSYQKAKGPAIDKGKTLNLFCWLEERRITGGKSEGRL